MGLPAQRARPGPTRRTLTGKEENGAGEFGYQRGAVRQRANTRWSAGPSNKEGVGAAWVLTRSGTAWTPQATLTGSGESGAGEFGESVAISEKGEYALIGGPGNNERVGAAWVLFRESGKTTWASQATLTGKEESGKGEFGYSVAIASKEAKEAGYALIGGPGQQRRRRRGVGLLPRTEQNDVELAGEKLTRQPGRTARRPPARASRCPPRANTR